jgi:hypothetical protein
MPRADSREHSAVDRKFRSRKIRAFRDEELRRRFALSACGLAV